MAPRSRALPVGVALFQWVLLAGALPSLRALGDPACPPLHPCGEPPTAGVAVPAAAIAGEHEATAIEVSPAGLGQLPSWSIQYLHTQLDERGVRGPGGDALYLAAPVPYLEQLGVGAALQSVRPPSLFPYGNVVKFSLGLGWRPVPALSFGASYAHVFVPGGTGLDTLDLGASARLGPWAAIALVVHDTPSPQFLGLGLQRVYEAEAAFRPFGDDRLELAIGARLGERRLDVDPRARIAVQPTPGLILRGALELKRDIDGDGRPDNDLRATVGVELNLARVGAGGYVHFGSATGAGRLHGGSAMLRVSGDRYPSLYTPKRFERIDLAAGGDRAHVALLSRLRRFEHDSRADGIVLVLGEVDGSWAAAEELRDQLQRLRAAGKHVFAYGAEINTKAYYVASAAEKIFLDPAGGLRLVGMSSTAMYFRGSFDLLGVRADFLKIAEYKSAPEQYTRTGPTPEAAMVRAAIYDDIYARLVARIGEARHFDATKARAILDAGPYTAAEARRAGLVDDLRHGDEIEDAIGQAIGHRVEAVAPDSRTRRPRSWQPPQIAVLFAEGDLVDGKSQTIPILDRRLVGHRTFLEAITALRGDPTVKAIVLRIDSPGGSALASDLIAREIDRTRKVKPVVCTFGDVAASGGYFIAAGCDVIFAAPSTITGSIGIFTGKFDISGLAGKLGISHDTMKRGEHADVESMWRPYTDDERRMLMEKLRYYYDRFVDTVAAGRRMTHDEVDRVAHGRVWTGAQARDVHLVDRLGGFMDAVVEAKRRAGISEWEPVELKAWPDEPQTLLGQLARLLGINVNAGAPLAALADLPSLAPLLRALPASLLVAPSTPQARMEFSLSDDR